ncbi:YihY/virulence factor BrkB family protein (plasmid) [Humibacter sp. BT305]|nr:YihY/virulence factor BrkB family protein [Humibacter sp. BT305]
MARTTPDSARADSARADSARADSKGAPDPDDPRKPDDPTDVTKPSWKYVLTKTAREFSKDQCTDIAAALTYYAVLSLFPALIAIFSLLGVIGQGQAAADAVLDIIGSVAPGGTADIVRDPIQQFASSPAAGFALVSGIVLAIWSASGYVGAFSRAMNRIYEIPEGRPFWKLKPVQLLVTVISIVLVALAAVILVVSGPVADAIGGALGLGGTVQTVWAIVKWPVLAFVVVLILAILYYATPNAKQPKFRWLSMGALLAIIVLAIATVAFGFYVANFSNYDKNYGSLAGVVIFLLWLWIVNNALLFGAEFDAELERGRELQAGIAAERSIQLPPRDTRKSDKAAKKQEVDVLKGRLLRESRGKSTDSSDTRRRRDRKDESGT